MFFLSNNVLQKRQETGDDKEIPNTNVVTKQKPPRVSAIRPPDDPIAIRTIVISGLPVSIDSSILWKKIRKYNGAKKVDWPVKSESKDEDSTGMANMFRFRRIF